MSNQEKMLQDCLESCKEGYQENADLREENERLKAHEEGAKVAYQTLIDEKEELRLKLEKTERYYQDAVEQIQSQHKENERLMPLRRVLEKVVKWEEKYPTDRIYSQYTIVAIAKEMSDIVAEAREVLKDTASVPNLPSSSNCWPLENSRTGGGI